MSDYRRARSPGATFFFTVVTYRRRPLFAEACRVGTAHRFHYHLLMSDYRRARSPGATFFFTVVTYHRRPLFAEARKVELLGKIIRQVQSDHPFVAEAWVVLPDHMHALWTLPTNDSDYSKRWGLIKATFSNALRSSTDVLPSATPSRVKHREGTVRQRRFWEHQIRNETDFARHADYIHFNPVKHGHVQRVCDWPYSTFHRYVRRGVYPLDWGGGDPADDSAEEFGEPT